jgi:hypothetical protein
MFGELIFTTALSQPQMQGFEKLTLGLSDAAAFRPIVKLSYRKDQIYLERVRPPNIIGGRTQEILLDRADMAAFPKPDRVSISLRVDASGKVSAAAQIVNGDKTMDFSLTPSGQDAMVDPAYSFYTLSVFVETMPMSAIGKVNQAKFNVASLRHKKEPAAIRIQGRLPL